MSIDLDAIRNRLAAASSSPWYLQPNDLIGGWCVRTVDLPPSESHGDVADFIREEDARFIAHSPEDVRLLLSEVERLRSLLVDAVERITADANAEVAKEREAVVRYLHHVAKQGKDGAHTLNFQFAANTIKVGEHRSNKALPLW